MYMCTLLLGAPHPSCLLDNSNQYIHIHAFKVQTGIYPLIGEEQDDNNNHYCD